jgi:hypothetical protein
VSGGLVRLALDHALAHRFSVLLEGTFRDPEMVTATARRFAGAGYRVEVVAVATPAAVSRLSAEQRSLGRRGGVFGRWTPPQAHEAALAGSSDTVAALEALPVVSRIQVYSRVELLYENTRNSRDQWQSEPRAAEVLRAEQNRRLSPPEAADWLARYEQVFADAVARPGYLDQATMPAFRLLERDAADMILAAAAGSSANVNEPRRRTAARRVALEAAVASPTRLHRAGRGRAGPSSPSGLFGQPQRPSVPGRGPPGLTL